MAWIESHQELAHHPKVARLAGALNVEKAAAIGYLHMFWWWCLSYAEDGDVTGFAAVEVADGAQWRGDAGEFLAALEEAGWLDDGMVHDWYDYGGKLAERRRQDAERKRAARLKASERRPSDDRTDGVRRQQQTTEDNTTASADVAFDAFLAKRAAEAVRDRKRKGLEVKSEGGLARTIQADPDFLAEAERVWAHRNCENCGGKGSVKAYAPGAGMVESECQGGVG